MLESTHITNQIGLQVVVRDGRFEVGRYSCTTLHEKHASRALRACVRLHANLTKQRRKANSKANGTSLYTSCMSKYTYVYYICLYMSICLKSMSVYTSTCLHTCLYDYIRLYVCLCVHMSVYMFARSAPAQARNAQVPEPLGLHAHLMQTHINNCGAATTANHHSAEVICTSSSPTVCSVHRARQAR